MIMFLVGVFLRKIKTVGIYVVIENLKFCKYINEQSTFNKNFTVLASNFGCSLTCKMFNLVDRFRRITFINHSS
jgi:hypothetical protein